MANPFAHVELMTGDVDKAIAFDEGVRNPHAAPTERAFRLGDA